MFFRPLSSTDIPLQPHTFGGTIGGIFNWWGHLWPAVLNNLPMNDNHKAQLLTHWKNLPEDFRVAL